MDDVSRTNTCNLCKRIGTRGFETCPWRGTICANRTACVKRQRRQGYRPIS